MKMAIKMVILVLIVVMVAIFTLALTRAAAEKTPMEQMQEDAEQRRYIEAWIRQNKRSGSIDNTSGDVFGHNGESLKKEEIVQKDRGLSGPKE